MAVTRAHKVELLQDLKDKFQKAQSVIFTHYIGLNVAQVSKLRSKLRAGKAELKVAKKTLMQIAAKDVGLPDLDNAKLDGPVACIFSYDDPLTGAQIAFTFGKEHPQVVFLGGLFEGKILSEAEAKSLAQIPGRTALLGMFASILQSPLRSFMSISSSPLVGFARAANEMAKKGGFVKEPAPAPAPTPEAPPAPPIEPQTAAPAEAATDTPISPSNS